MLSNKIKKSNETLCLLQHSIWLLLIVVNSGDLKLYRIVKSKDHNLDVNTIVKLVPLMCMEIFCNQFEQGFSYDIYLDKSTCIFQYLETFTHIGDWW